MTKQKQILVYDFDGVICKSVDIKTDAFLELYKNCDESIKSRIVKYHHKHGGISRFKKIQYIEGDLLGNKIDERYLEKMGKKFSKIVKAKVINADYVEGVLNFIQLNSKKYRQFICTGTPHEEIMEIVTKKNILKLFEGIYGSPQKKANILNEIISKNEVNSDDIIFFGDAITDYDAAKESCVRFIGIKNEKTNFPESTKLINNFLNFKVTDL